MEILAVSDIFFYRENRIDFAEGYLRFKEYIEAASIAKDELPEQLPPLCSAAKRFADCLGSMSRRRRFFSTKSGRIGLGPSDTRIGDTLVAIFYCPTPYLLWQGDHNWHFVGETYLHDLMYGEALEMFDNGKVQETKCIIE
jgi:hypothetical protein